MKKSRRSRNSVTLHQVAEFAGVSPMTVSRVINGKAKVREATKKRVQEAIEALGYRPDIRAQSLAKAKTLNLGMLYGNPSSNYASDFLVSILEASSRIGYSIILEKCLRPENRERAAKKLVASGVEGVILPAPLGDSDILLDIFDKANIITVSVGVEREDARGLSVRIDNFKAAKAMTNYLLSLGHKDIAFIKGHPDQRDSERRYEGFLAALRQAGLSLNPKRIAQGYYTYQSGLEEAEVLLATADYPTAIFASNDDMAAGAMTAAHKRGLRVPQDISIAGFDDTPLATTIWPTLTTVRQPVDKMAEAAINMLVQTMNHDTAQPDQGAMGPLFFDCEVIFRESSDAPEKC